MSSRVQSAVQEATAGSELGGKGDGKTSVQLLILKTSALTLFMYTPAPHEGHDLATKTGLQVCRGRAGSWRWS